jgi:DNA mismatch repair protein MLH3
MPPGTQTMRPSNAKASDRLPEREAAHQLTGETLREARIINQVDMKFIACTLRSASASQGTSRESGNTLVLIDQHAADERIRVEHLLAPPCEAFLAGNAIDQSQVLPEPKLILLTQRERQNLMTPIIQEAFARWGLTFAPDTGNDGVEDNGMTHHQVAVASVPTVIATKVSHRPVPGPGLGLIIF